MSFMSSFQKYVEQRLAEALAQSQPRPPVMLPDQAMLENVALPLKSGPMMPSPTMLPPMQDRRSFLVPGAQGPSTSALDAQAARQMAGQRIAGQMQRSPEVLSSSGLAPFQLEQEREQQMNQARLAGQQPVVAQQQEVQSQAQQQATAGIDQQALAKMVNGIVAQGYSRESAISSATEVLTGFEAGGVHVTATDVDQYLIDTTAQKAGSIQFESEDTDSALESALDTVTGAVSDVAGKVASPVLDKGLGVLEAPLNFTEDRAGQRIYDLATGEETYDGGIDQLTGQPREPDGWDAFALDPANKEAIVAAYTNGYQAKDTYGNVIAEFGPGERAVWEMFASTQGNVEKSVRQVVMDPVNWTGFGGAASRGARLGARGARVEARGAQQAARVAEESGDEAAAAAARGTARTAERDAAAMNAVATILRGIDLPNEVVDRSVGFLFGQLRRGASAVAGVSDRVGLDEAIEEVGAVRAARARAEADAAATVPTSSTSEVVAPVIEPPPTRGFGPGGIGPAPTPDVTTQTPTIITPPQPAIAAAPQPAYEGAPAMPPLGQFTPAETPTQARLGPSTPEPGAEPLPTGATGPRQAALTDVPPPQQAVVETPTAPAVETPPVVVDDAAGVVTFDGVDDIRVKRTGQGSRTRWSAQVRKGGRWINTSEKMREQSDAVAQARSSILARTPDVDEAVVPGTAETSVLAQGADDVAEAITPPVRERPARPHDAMPPKKVWQGGKRVDLNYDTRRSILTALPEDAAVMPRADLKALDPSYAKDDLEAVPTFAEQVAFEIGPRNPVAARAFWDEYEPEALRFLKEDARLQRESGGKAPDARETPKRELHRVEFEARREQLFREKFGGDAAPIREPRYDTDLPNIPSGNKKEIASSGNAPEDLRAIIEQAVFGEDDVATRARGYLHAAVNNPAINAALGGNPSAVARRLSALRKGLYGEESLSQTKYAKGKRAKEAKQADALGIVKNPEVEARRLYRRTIDRAQASAEESADPGYVDEVTQADGLYNGGHLDDDQRRLLNQEIAAPQVKKSDDGTWYDAGFVSKKRATTFRAGETGRVGVIKPVEGGAAQLSAAGRPMGRTTVFDAIDDLVGRGLSDEEVNRTVGRLLAEVRGVKVPLAIREMSTVSRVLGGWNRMMRENTQFWIGRIFAGWLQDAVSDGWTGVVHGMPGLATRQLNPRLNYRTFKAVRGGDFEQEMLNNHPVFRYITEMGDEPPKDLAALGQSRVDTPLSGATTAGKVLNVDVRGHRVGVGGIFASEYARDIRTTGDRVRRFLAFDHTLRAETRDAATRFDALMVSQAERRGIDVVEWHRAITDQMAKNGTVVDGRVVPKSIFSPADIRQAIPGGDGEFLARAWRGEVKGARNRARAKVSKMYFSYKGTKLDDKMRHFTFFHYWMTRATVMHAEMALRNPYLAATYFKMWEGMKNNAEREGYPDTLKSYIRFMGDSIFGAHAYIDALSFIVPFMMFREVSSEYAKPWERMGLYLNPMADAVLGVLGMSENVPNLMGTGGLETRVTAVLNYLKAEGIELPGINDAATSTELVTRKVFKGIVEGANDALRSVIPSVREFSPFDPAVYARDQMTHLIDARAEQVYGPRAGWTPEQQQEVYAAYEALGTDARSNPLSAWAFDQWAQQSLVGQAFAWIAPVRVRTKVRDENIVLADQGMDAITDSDPSTQPTPEQQAALDAKDRATSGDPALVDMDQRYRAIGTPEQHDQADIYNTLVHGTPEEVEAMRAKWVMILPGDLAGKDWATMSFDERTAEAERVMAWIGGAEEREAFVTERDAFVEGSPEYAAYKKWSDDMYDFPGEAMAAAEALRAVSPNFDAFVTDQESKPGGLTVGDVTSVDAYLAWKGEQWDTYTEARPARDQSAIPVGLDEIGGGGSGSGGSGEKKSKMTDAEKQAERIAEDVAEYEAYAAIADQYVDSMNPGLTFDSLEQGSRKFVKDNLEAAGLKPPGISDEAHLYMLWRSVQPVGADTSVEAFVAYLDGIQNAQAEAIGVDPKAIEAVGDAGKEEEDD